MLLRRPRIAAATAAWLSLAYCCCAGVVVEGRLLPRQGQVGHVRGMSSLARSLERSLQEAGPTGKASKGKGSPNPGPGDDENDEPEEASPAPTPSPTVSAAPSTSTAPSSTPTVSLAPSTAPSSAPSTLPTVAPSLAPSGAPSLPPSGMPSFSGSPTQFPYATTVVDAVAEDASPSLVSECGNPVPATGISPVVPQLFSFHYQIQVAATAQPIAGTLNEAAGAVEALLHQGLAEQLLGDCSYDENPSFVKVDSYTVDRVIGEEEDEEDNCPQGRVCWVVQADFVASLFYSLPTATRTRQLIQQHQQLERQLQNEPTAINPVIEDSSLIVRVGGILRDSLAVMDTGDDGLVYKFTGFANAAIEETTGDTEQAGDRDGGIAAAVQEIEAGADSNQAAISGLAVAAAACVLVAVLILSVQRRREYSRQSKSLQHFALENDDYYEDEYSTASDEEIKSRDCELPSNNNNNNHATQDILADLASLNPDQEEASYSGSLASYRSNREEGSAVSSTYRKVYVLSDAASASPPIMDMEGFELPYEPNRYNDSPSVGPMFIKTEASLRSAMADLNSTHAPLTSRRYGAEDTVNL